MIFALFLNSLLTTTLWVSVAQGKVVVQKTKVPVNVMLDLNTISGDGNSVNNYDKLRVQLKQLKDGNVDGVMADFWYGLIESSPKQYNWEGYKQLTKLVKEANLKLTPVLSFHACGGNVGDTCDIPLPKWVRDSSKDAFFTDQYNNINYEYISFGADKQNLFQGRSAIQLYEDFMISFTKNILEANQDIIKKVEVGLGPAGELRYPSYPSDRWQWPGVGEFQTYDKFLTQKFVKKANAAGHNDWNRGPSDAGHYNSKLGDTNTNFWTNGIKTEYGHFYLTFVKDELLEHADLVLGKASEILTTNFTVTLKAKVAGIHWLYNTESHAAEATAGYVNTQGINTYKEIAETLKKHKTTIDFTCLEMKDHEQSSHANSSPEKLVRQVKIAARDVGIDFEGENALPRYDVGAYQQIAYNLHSEGVQSKGFTYLRISDDLMYKNNNWDNFRNFVNSV